MHRRIIRRFGICLAVAAEVVLAQAPPAVPVAFEVAVIRAAPPAMELIQQLQNGKAKVGLTVDGSRVDMGFLSLADLVGMAYKLKPYQVQGPDWMSKQRFDIQAKIPDGVSKDKVPDMLQALLADRFKMTMHKEKKDQPIYALIVGKNGPKLTEAAALTQPAPDRDGDDPQAEAPRFQFKNGPNGVVMLSGNTRVTSTVGPDGTHQEINRITMPNLANSLSSYFDRPVIDMTDLAGEYQLALDISREDIRLVGQRAQQRVADLGLPLPVQQVPEGNPSEASGPGGGSVFAAVEKLGLKLESRKAPVDVIVIDHLEKSPTEN